MNLEVGQTMASYSRRMVDRIKPSSRSGGWRIWRGWASWLLLAAATLAGGAAAAQQSDRAPVLLRKTLLLTPVETAGTGLAPEVRVRVDLDDRGKVVQVTALSVKPASEYDELFRQVTHDQISYWRYAPAIQGGKATATTLDWTVKFQALGQREERTGLGMPLLGPTPSDAEARRARILALPLEQRKALLRQEAQIAEKLLDRSHRQRFDSPRFVVVSDAKAPKTAEITARNLEAVFHVIRGIFGGRHPEGEPTKRHPEGGQTKHLALLPEPYKIVVYLFAGRAAFDGLKTELDVYEWSAGFYSPSGLFAFHLQMPSMESLLGTMMHEATHAFVDRHLVVPGSHLPRWLGEGFAEYMGNSEVKKGRLIPGRTAKEKYVLVMGLGAMRAKPAPRISLDEAKRLIRRGEGLTVEQLTTADSETFYGEERALFYPSSWLLVHFLRHGEPGWAEEEFPAFMLYAAEGYPAAAAMKTVYGAAPAELEERFRRYVQKEF